MVQPEGHPRGEDDDDGGEVDGEEVVGDLTLESHVHRQAAVLPCKRRHRNRKAVKPLSLALCRNVH